MLGNPVVGGGACDRVTDSTALRRGADETSNDGGDDAFASADAEVADAADVEIEAKVAGAADDLLDEATLAYAGLAPDPIVIPRPVSTQLSNAPVTCASSPRLPTNAGRRPGAPCCRPATLQATRSLSDPRLRRLRLSARRIRRANRSRVESAIRISPPDAKPAIFVARRTAGPLTTKGRGDPSARCVTSSRPSAIPIRTSKSRLSLPRTDCLISSAAQTARSASSL